MSAEWHIVLVNLIILCLAYGLIYPRFAGNDMRKISYQDVLASVVSLTVIGSVYFGSDVTLSFFGLSLNWFWFTLLTYALIEIPCFLWYHRQYGVKFPKD
ncbi:hypothetical protein ACFOEE_00050 [Pseudoalteromonas fenneropenaei]|uniref:Uncharacterized protein n=1 Tax=Pseudoalteromonas fenneropenaei TaxID=1737459 RepID=A0ABV7CC23_9GAMM